MEVILDVLNNNFLLLGIISLVILCI